MTVAGSDSSGGAGIQADLRALGTTGVVGASAITAVTSQGVNGVVAIELVSPELLKSQIEEAFGMYEFAAVKIGMLGGLEQVRVVAESLLKYRPKNIVLDPVLASTGGIALLDEEGIAELKEKLIPLADVITPNREELAKLSKMPVSTDEECYAAVNALRTKPHAVVIVTGGDQPRARDLVIGLEGGAVALEETRVETVHTHGTGCAFSALLARSLADERSIRSAILYAKSRIQNSLQFPIVPKNGTGHPNLYQSVTFLSGYVHAKAFRETLSGIYAITDITLNPRLSHLDIVSKAMKGGATCVQLRDKQTSTAELISIGKEIRNLTLNRALFIVNDRVDVALACDADGVHIGPDDMDLVDARRLLGWDRIVGCSVGTVDEAIIAGRSATYLAVGAIFGSSTKGDAGSPVGTELITSIRRCFNGPVVAIGGINLSNIASVAAAGADVAAVVSAIVCAEDLEQATRDLLAEFERGKERRL